MNWLARYRDNYEQETKDLIADLDQAIKDQKYPKTDQQLQQQLDKLGLESFKEYDLSYMIVSEDQIKQIQDEK